MIAIRTKKIASNKNILFMAAIIDMTFKYAPKGLQKKHNTTTGGDKGRQRLEKTGEDKKAPNGN